MAENEPPIDLNTLAAKAQHVARPVAAYPPQPVSQVRVVESVLSTADLTNIASMVDQGARSALDHSRRKLVGSIGFQVFFGVLLAMIVFSIGAWFAQEVLASANRIR